VPYVKYENRPTNEKLARIRFITSLSNIKPDAVNTLVRDTGKRNLRLFLSEFNSE
jgi:hypothetical protein